MWLGRRTELERFYCAGLPLCARPSDADKMIATIHSYSQRAPQDYAEAVKWYRLAANQGYANRSKPLRVRVPRVTWRDAGPRQRTHEGSTSRRRWSHLMEENRDTAEAQKRARECKPTTQPK